MKIQFLTKAEKKNVLNKVAIHVARRLERLKSDGLLFVEISKITGLTPNRISEIVNNHEINESGFKALLEGGLITVGEIIDKVPELSEKEKAFIDGFRVHENKNEIGRRIVKLKDMGVDVLKLLDAAIGKAGKAQK